MSGKCVAKGCCSSFVAIVCLIFIITFAPSLFYGYYYRRQLDRNTLTVYLSDDEREGKPSVQCNVTEEFNKPSLRSFIQTTTKGEDQEFLLSGLAVYSNLTTACQPLRDVSKAKIQVHKVALVTLANNNDDLCPLENLAVSAQNAGYSVLIYFAEKPWTKIEPSEDELLIPVLRVGCKECKIYAFNKKVVVRANYFLAKSDRTCVEIRVPPSNQYTAELSKLKPYLVRLYYWFLVGPVITLEWLRRTRKFCWMSGGQHEDGSRDAVGSRTTGIRNMEEAANSNEEPRLNSPTGETVENHHGTDDEGQPLLLPVSHAEYTRQTHRDVRYLNFIVQICHKIAVGFCYQVLVIAALPVGISTGGLSFFRFDEGDISSRTSFLFVGFSIFWSPFQIFCFFMYSRFACKTTWTVQTNFSKLIRSDWFASNIYLLILGFVVPYCSETTNYVYGVDIFYFVTYDTMCTVSNALFIIILNKHKFVTRYVFYISVCMIFAYLESDVVAVFYFALNWQGSLNNLKLTALRTVAIGLTLTISFNSSMHIIRKIVKPEESLFESLGEK